jgi:hypothetical protein
MADVLYGVTMQEQGLSKIVSVRFHKADEASMDHPPGSLETPTNAPSVEWEGRAAQARGDAGNGDGKITQAGVRPVSVNLMAELTESWQDRIIYMRFAEDVISWAVKRPDP